MQALLKTWLDLALLRRGPGDLPDSVTLFGLAACAYLSAGALQAWLIYGGDRLAERILADLALVLLPVWILLRATGRGHRYNQTTSAMLGVGALLGPVVVPLLWLSGPAERFPILGLVLYGASVGLILWYTLAIGHILRSALDLGRLAGVAIAATYLLGTATVLTRLFPSEG